MNYIKIPKTGIIGKLVDNITVNFQLTKELSERLEATKGRSLELFSSLLRPPFKPFIPHLK